MYMLILISTCTIINCAMYFENNHRRGGYDLFTNQNKRQLKRLLINNKIAIV